MKNFTGNGNMPCPYLAPERLDLRNPEHIAWVEWWVDAAGMATFTELMEFEDEIHGQSPDAVIAILYRIKKRHDLRRACQPRAHQNRDLRAQERDLEAAAAGIPFPAHETPPAPPAKHPPRRPF